MEHWEFSHLPFDGDVKDDKIVCQNCGWSWKTKDGGSDLYNCHNCNYDNTSAYLGEEYSNVVDPNAIASGVTALAGLGGSLAQAKASKSASKGDLQKEIEARCGKDKSSALSKSKKKSYIDCREKAIKSIEQQQQQQLKSSQLDSDVKQKSILEAQKTKRNQMFIVGSVVIVAIISFIVYKKMSK
jgi:hypothetical protein